MSPHVFMLSTDEQKHNANRSAAASNVGAFDYSNSQHRSSVQSRNSMGPLSHQNSNNEEHKGAQDGGVVTKYDQQRAISQQISANGNLTEGQEEQFVEEEYYIEEEIEESVEAEQQSMQTFEHAHTLVDTIKEVSSDQENQSLGNSAQKNLTEPMGTIMHTVSLSGGKKNHMDSAHFTQSQRAMNASDFKELPGPFSSSSKHTDSNMASLVFRPRDSDAAQYAMQQSMSIHSNPSKKNSSKKGDALLMHNSHPSFGFNNQH